MTKELLTIEGFRASVKDGATPPDAMVVSATAGEPQPGSSSRRIKFVFSDGTVDRAGDTIDPAGWQLGTFVKNPVALFGHDSSSIECVIGKAVNVGAVGGKLVGEIEFAEASVNPRADMCFKMVKAGLLNAVSVGFLPIDFSFSVDKERRGGMDFKRQELLEISIVPIPANANALVTARSMGIDTAPMKEWAGKIVDADGSVIVPKNFLEATFRAAKTPRAVRNKYLSGTAPLHQKASESWKVGGARDLPVDDSSAAWDGPAAAAGIFSSAGFDGDSPDSAAARRGFLIYDSANPKLKGSYKLPFARMVGGSLKAVASGIRAAASRLPQTDAPASVLDDARKVLDAYETKMGSSKPDDSGKTLDMLGKRGMPAVAALAWLLDRLSDIEDSVEAEAAQEGDDSKIPDRLQAAVAALGQILVDMTAEEVAELASDTDDDDGSDASNGMMPMMMSARTPGQKALMRLAMLAQSKAGRVLSAANTALLQQAKDSQTKAMGAMGQASSMMSGAMDQHQKALDMHSDAMGCIKSVLTSGDDETGEDVDPGTEGGGATDHLNNPDLAAASANASVDPEVAKEAAAEAERQRRIRRARALAVASQAA